MRGARLPNDGHHHSGLGAVVVVAGAELRILAVGELEGQTHRHRHRGARVVDAVTERDARQQVRAVVDLLDGEDHGT